MFVYDEYIQTFAKKKERKSPDSMYESFPTLMETRRAKLLMNEIHFPRE